MRRKKRKKKRRRGRKKKRRRRRKRNKRIKKTNGKCEKKWMKKGGRFNEWTKRNVTKKG